VEGQGLITLQQIEQVAGTVLFTLVPSSPSCVELVQVDPRCFAFSWSDSFCKIVSSGFEPRLRGAQKV
jgi:hypothetical protein